MKTYFKHWRVYVGLTLLLASEFMLFGSAEGIQKWQSILWGSIPNVLLTVGFIFL